MHFYATKGFSMFWEQRRTRKCPTHFRNITACNPFWHNRSQAIWESRHRRQHFYVTGRITYAALKCIIHAIGVCGRNFDASGHATIGLRDVDEVTLSWGEVKISSMFDPYQFTAVKHDLSWHFEALKYSI